MADMEQEPIPEYQVNIRVRNNWLLRRMAACGMQSGADLARAAGISRQSAWNMIALKTSPIQKRTGDLVPSALKVCEALNAYPGELWPPQHLEEPLKHNSATLELTREDISTLIGYDHESSPEQLLVDARTIDYGLKNALDSMTPREQEVIKRLFGVDGYEPQTFDEVAETQGVTRERIRQIELKALRRARHRLENVLHTKSAEDYGSW